MKNKSMTTTRKNYGPFNVVVRTIRATLKFGPATLKCEIQQGQTPMGRAYKSNPQWWIKLDGSPCAMGPWTAEGIRTHYGIKA